MTIDDILCAIARLRPIVLVLCALSLAAVGTFRSFGYDLDIVWVSYPYVADGWGAWYWLAGLGLDFNLYFFLLSCLLSTGILLLAFPAHAGKHSQIISATIVIYFSLWFLFAHTRYGMAVVMISLALAENSTMLLVAAAIIAFFFHKAIAGGMILVVLWLLLRNCKHGLIIAIFLSCSFGLILSRQFGTLLSLSNYQGYADWGLNAPARTPLKYYYDIGILALWKCFNRKAPDNLLILAVLFLPTAYYNVLAGRAHEFYAAILLSSLLTGMPPKGVRYAIAAEYLIDAGALAFLSGAFF
jgi:hypothetical protein